MSNPEVPADDSAEIQATTFVVDGIPMSFAEMKAYRAQKEAAQRQSAEDNREDDDLAEEEDEEDETVSNDPKLGSMEFRQMTYILPGQPPMSFDEMVAYNEQQEKDAQDQADFHANEDEIRKNAGPTADVNQMLLDMEAEEARERAERKQKREQ